MIYPFSMIVTIGLFVAITLSAWGGDEVLITRSELIESGSQASDVTYTIAVLENANWEAERVEQAIRETEDIYQQCGIKVSAGEIHWLKVPGSFRVMTESRQISILAKLPSNRPIVVFIDQTTDQDTAYAYLASAPTESRGTAWLTQRGHRSCTGMLMAHELGHILIQTDGHIAESTNLMAYSCTHSNITNPKPAIVLTEPQCEKLRSWR